MADLDNVDFVRRMSTTDIDKRNKADLKRALMTLVKETSNDAVDDQTSMLREILTEVRNLKKEREEIKKEMAEMRTVVEELRASQDENERLKNQMKQQAAILKQHQLFLERLDAKERECNLIVLGVPEVDGIPDLETVQRILATAKGKREEFEPVISVRRLGTKMPDKIRPMLIVMPSNESRNGAVDAARGNRDPALKDIRIKKDAHSSVRAEWSRLFKVKEEEEKKPGNAVCHISIDMKKRQVLRDGLVIDSWCQQLF